MNSRYEPVCFAVLASTLLASCSATTTTLSTSTSTPTPTPTRTMGGSSAPYFIGHRPVWVDTEYIDRYACRSGKVLICERTSRIQGAANCRCPD
jgi:hypothetical protein